MNIRGIVDKMKAPFEKGQKLEKLYPAFNAFETFLGKWRFSLFTLCQLKQQHQK